VGEATHGTREFFQFKHRMLEFLVTELHFNGFAIESSYSGCQAINECILHGTGDLDSAFRDKGMLPGTRSSLPRCCAGCAPTTAERPTGGSRVAIMPGLGPAMRRPIRGECGSRLALQSLARPWSGSATRTSFTAMSELAGLSFLPVGPKCSWKYHHADR
jgi:hypothetical protein